MINFLHVIDGWGKTMRLIKISPAVRELSLARLKVCAGCPHAVESSFLKAIKSMFHSVDAIRCNKCGCPVNEKSLVPGEKCPLGKWENIDKILNTE